MFVNEYVAEKLRDLDEERLTQATLRHRAEPVHGADAPRTKPVIGPVMRVAGRTLRRAGEGLEGWASPGPAEGERRWAERSR